MTEPSAEAAPALAVGDRFVLTVDRVGVGGDGVAQAPDGRVVFVRAGLPGDVLEVEVETVARRHLRAVRVRRISDGPERVAPFCVHAEVCGGCPWMALPAAAQHTALREHVQHQLNRAIGERAPTVDPMVVVPPDRAWRSTARLHWDEGVVGYNQARSRALLEVAHCPVLSPQLATVLTEVRTVLPAALIGRGTLRLTADAEGGTVTVEPEGPLHAEDSATLDAALALLVKRTGPIRGAVRLSRGRVVNRFGVPSNTLGPAGTPHPAEGFAQAHQPGNAALVAAVVAALKGARRVLELYAGSGNFTLALAAAGTEVRAVEVAVSGAAALRAEAEKRGLGERVRAMAGDAAQLPTGNYDAALIDPPRAGAAAAVAALHEAGLRKLVYVACDPATLARDLGWLCARGWVVRSATPYDLFPHTGHVEMLVVAERTGRA